MERLSQRNLLVLLACLRTSAVGCGIKSTSWPRWTTCHLPGNRWWWEVLCWVAEGKTDREIGVILGVSARTVHKHIEHLFVKLGVETRTAAAAWVYRRAATSP